MKKRYIAIIALVALGAGASIGQSEENTPVASVAATTTTAPATTVAETTTTERATTTTEVPDITLAPTTTIARTTTTEYVMSEYETEIIFLAFVRQNTTYSAAVDDATIIDMAHTVCEALDAGVSWDLIVLNASISLDGQGQGYLAEDVGVIYGAGMQTFCPQYADELEEVG